jgi:hypothetical protein
MACSRPVEVSTSHSPRFPQKNNNNNNYNNTEPRPAAAADFFFITDSMIHTKLVRSHDDVRARERKRYCACLLARARSLLTATTAAAAAQQQLDPLNGSQKATFVGLRQETKDSLSGLF